MADHNKTKDQLIHELIELRQRVTELEDREARRKKVAIEQADWLTTRQEQYGFAEALQWGGVVLASTLNYEKVLDHIMDQTGRILSYKAACILLVEGKTARVYRWRGYDRFGAADSLDSTPFRLDEIPLLATIQETGWPVVLSTIADHDEWIAKSGQTWIKSSLNVAIRTQLRLFGFLRVDSDLPGFYSQVEAERLQAFANQAALALENARRYDQARQEIVKRVKELKKERNFISAIVDTAGALVVVLNAKGRIVRFNPACEQTTGYPNKQVLGRCLWELFLVPDEVAAYQAVLEALRSGQTSIAHENCWVTKDGEHRLVAWSSTALFDQDGTVEYIISTGIDITERQQAEREREKLIEELDAFAHTVAHDLQEPVALMVGFASSLVEFHSTLSEKEFKDHLRAIMKSARKMTNIVDELLLLAGVRKREVVLAPLDMDEIVAEAQQRLAHLIEENQAQIILPDHWPVALGYGPWIEEVWTNYLSNAIKYGGTPPRIELGATLQEDHTIRFWVQDNGAGLAPEDQAKLFTPFTQLSQAQVEGYGLGLSIVRRIVEKLGGQVAVENKEEAHQGGCVFSFILPAVSEREAV